MSEQSSWTTIDKTEWGEGPWLSEPDKLQWVDEATDLDCLIVRGPMGALCGYVGVPPDHPYHGRGYSDLDLEVHGGLTFASACDEDAPEGEGICHVPAPGRPADVWWLGFDCGHAFDAMPALEARSRSLGMPALPAFDYPGGPQTTYKPVGYVRAEVAALAAQIARLDADDDE